jgi:hypothetical protein
MGGFRRECINVRLLMALLVLIASAGNAAHAQNLRLGATYRDHVIVADRSVPLLDGEWTVVAVEESRSSKGSGDIEQVYLAQMAGNRLSRWIHIATNEEWSSGGWGRNKHVCDRKDVHAGYSDSSNKPKDSECWILNHVGQTLGKNPPQASIDFYRWSDSRGRPNMALALSYYLEKRGDFVRADYYFNPVVAGFRDTGGAGWRGSPWHADIASKDERKLAYLRELKATGEELFGRLKGIVK